MGLLSLLSHPQTGPWRLLRHKPLRALAGRDCGLTSPRSCLLPTLSASQPSSILTPLSRTFHSKKESSEEREKRDRARANGRAQLSLPLLFHQHKRSHIGHHHHHDHGHPVIDPSGGKKPSDRKEDERESIRVTNLGLASNVVLAVGKGVAGVMTNSTGLLADAVHSVSDMLSDFVTLWTVKMARAPPDENHPYGHGKFEALGTLMVGALLFSAGGGIGWHGLEQILMYAEVIPAHPAAGHHHHDVSDALAMVNPGLAAGAALFSIVVKEWLFHATVKVGKKTNSNVLIANAWHHRADSVSSVIAFLGLMGAMYGYPYLDPAAGVIVSGMIMKMGASVCWDSIRELTDENLQADVVKFLDEQVRSVPDVKDCGNIRARRMGPYTLVDLRIQVDSNMSVSAAQQVATKVKLRIAEVFPQVSEVLVYVDADAVSRKDSLALHGAEGLRREDMMRAQAEIREDIVSALRTIAEVRGASHLMIHWRGDSAGVYANEVEVQIAVDPNIRVRDASAIADRVRRAVQEISDVRDADVHLELGEQGHAAQEEEWFYRRQDHTPFAK